ncbi:MAG: hypothetical protein SO179_07685 [Bacteroidales bacterium]|nr:hypothetical protein [Bacteroidales bacterium]
MKQNLQAPIIWEFVDNNGISIYVAEKRMLEKALETTILSKFKKEYVKRQIKLIEESKDFNVQE